MPSQVRRTHYWGSFPAVMQIDKNHFTDRAEGAHADFMKQATKTSNHSMCSSINKVTG